MSVLGFIVNFIKRGGIAVFFSTALVKFSSAILSIIIVRLLSKDDFGTLSFILSIYSIAIIIAGFGGNYSLLRYGSITTSLSAKKIYYGYTLVCGLKFVSIVSLALIFFTLVCYGREGGTLVGLLILLALSLFPFYCLEILRSYFRILSLNRLYSKVNVWNTVILLLIAVLFTFMWGVLGYIMSLIISPLLVFLFYNKKIIKYNSISSYNIDVDKKEFWLYGIHTSISGIANQIIFSIAPFLLGVLGASEHEIATFKVATIIPFTLLTLPGILMVTDFNYLSKNYKNGVCLKEYYQNYIKTVIPISFIIFSFLIYKAEWIIEMLFGCEYVDCIPMYRLFMIATFITYIYRNPLGNILLAVGKAQWNGYNTYVFCGLYVISSIFCYHIWGVYALVYSLCLTFVASGFVSFILYKKYLRLCD